MQVSSPTIIGRGRETGVLHEAVGRARDGNGGTVFLVGDAGLGKARLFRDCADDAVRQGMVVLRGRATAAGSTVPYRPLTEALYSLIRVGGVPDDPELKPYRLALGRLIPQWRDGLLFDSDDSPVVLAESVLRLLTAVGGSGGVLVCLSDLHDCDPETMDILEYLVDNLEGVPVLILAGLQPVASTALRLSQGCARRRVGTVLELGPLSDAEIGELAAACLDSGAGPDPAPNPGSVAEPVVQWLARTADGNPFVAEELLRGALDNGGLVEVDGQWRFEGGEPRHVPMALVDAVSGRVRLLDPRWHRALCAAAVIGRRFPGDVLRRVCDLTGAELRAVIQAGIDAQLLESSRGTSDWYRFRNAWTAEALADTMLPAERAAVAAAAADAVEALFDDLPGEFCQLAAGLRLAAGDGPAAGVLFARAGRRALSEGAVGSAESLLDRALDLLPAQTRAAERAEALTSLLYALAESGDVEQALARGAEIADSMVLPAVRRAEVLTRLGWVCVVGGRWEQAAGLVAAARRLLAEPAAGAPAGSGSTEFVPAEAAPGESVPGEAVSTESIPAESVPAGPSAMLDVVEAHLLTLGDLEGDGGVLAGRAEALAERAAGTAEQVPLPIAACQARQVLALLARRRSFEEADVHLRHMLEVAERHTLPIWRLRAQTRLATNELMRTGDDGPIRQARQAAYALGAITAGGQADASIAMQEVLYGRYDEAEAAADRLLAATTRMHQEGEAQFSLVIKIAAAAHRGRREAMRAVLGEFRRRGGEQSFHAPVVFGHRAICALLGEDRPGAEAEMARVRAWERTHPTIYYQSGRYGLDLLLEVLAGRAGGEQFAEIAATPASRLRWNRQFVLAAETVLLGRAGDAPAVPDKVEQTRQAAAPYPMAGRLILRLIAEPALAEGWGDPVGWLREAEEYFHTSDATAVAGACRSLLRKAGVRVMQRRSGLDAVPETLARRGVTVREYEVLVLLGERRANPEIAKLLFISPRTVEKHVASLMDKLHKSGRAELSDLRAELTT